MNKVELSVIICAYNPNIIFLNRVIQSLKNQTLDKSNWELIIVDNNSNKPFKNQIILNDFHHVKFISEPKPGLINARIAGSLNATANFIVTVDDDTVLNLDYLDNALAVFKNHQNMGIFGGRSKAEFIETPPVWITQFNRILCIKNLGDEIIISKLTKNEILNSYPTNGPFLIAYRKNVFLEYFLPHLNNNAISSQLGRKGKSLASGEDCDIVLCIYKNCFEVGYFPQLEFTHIIPPLRTERNYLSKLVSSSNKSWVQLLLLYGISPWSPISPISVPLRKLKAWFTYKAYQSEVNYIKWKGACGMYEGLAK